MIKPDVIADAESHLKRDKKLAPLIRAHGPCTIGRTRPDPFHILCTSIIGQQLSSKAADTIQARVVLAAAAGARFKPTDFHALEPEQLRACGLSNAKAKWLKALADAAHTGTLSFPALRKLDNESALEVLDALPGIGRWTAEMFLIFALGRLDIFSLGDAGLRRGVNVLYGKGEKLDDEATLEIAAKWAPYRSVASWYLWRAADGGGI